MRKIICAFMSIFLLLFFGGCIENGVSNKFTILPKEECDEDCSGILGKLTISNRSEVTRGDWSKSEYVIMRDGTILFGKYYVGDSEPSEEEHKEKKINQTELEEIEKIFKSRDFMTLPKSANNGICDGARYSMTYYKSNGKNYYECEACSPSKKSNFYEVYNEIIKYCEM